MRTRNHEAAHAFLLTLLVIVFLGCDEYCADDASEVECEPKKGDTTISNQAMSHECLFPHIDAMEQTTLWRGYQCLGGWSARPNRYTSAKPPYLACVVPNIYFKDDKPWFTEREFASEHCQTPRLWSSDRGVGAPSLLRRPLSNDLWCVIHRCEHPYRPAEVAAVKGIRSEVTNL